MVLRVGGSRGASDRLEALLVEAAREFSTMPQAQMGLSAFCRGAYGAETVELLTNCGFIGPAPEPAAASSSPSRPMVHACAGEAAPRAASPAAAPSDESAGAALTSAVAALVPAAASFADPSLNLCRCRSSSCFDPACHNRAERQRVCQQGPGTRRRGDKKQIAPESCLRPAAAGSAFCELCKCAACPEHNRGRTRFCFSKLCTTRELHRSRREGGAEAEDEAEAEASAARLLFNMHGRHSVPEAWPRSLKVAAKLGWLLVQNTPLDLLQWLEFADDLAARRADFVVHCSDVAWLFAAHCIKWPAPVHKFRSYALQACDAQAGTAAGIVDALVRVLRDMSGNAFPLMHARMSTKGRMHCGTGIIVHSQWLGLLRKLEVSSQAAAGDEVLPLGVSQSAYVLKPCQQDAVQLVAAWLGAIRQEWPRQISAASFEESADAIVKTIYRLRGLSTGSAGPLFWGPLGEPGMRSSSQPPKQKKARAAAFKPGYLVKHFTKCVLFRYEQALGLHWAELPLSSLSMAAVLRWTPDETHQCEAIADMKVADAARLFGFSPLLISGFACAASAVDELQMASLFRAPERELFRVVAEWRKQLEAAEKRGGETEDLFSPVMADFVGAAAAPLRGKKKLPGSKQ